MPAATSPFPPNTTPIAGDPSVALIAQVNRFQKSQGKPEYPLKAGPISDEISILAVGLLTANLTKAYINFQDPMTLEEMRSLTALTSGMAPGCAQAPHRCTPTFYINQHLVAATQTLAGFGDWAGLPPAKVGITEVGAGGKKKKAWWPWALGLAVAAGGFAYLQWGPKKLALTRSTREA